MAEYRHIASRQDLDSGPPHDLEAEQCLLGSLLYDFSGFEDVSPDPQWFYSPENEAICRTMVTLWDDGLREIDAVVLGDALTQTGRLQVAGGYPRLRNLLESVPHGVHAGYYAGIVENSWRRRHLIYQAKALQDAAARPQTDIDDLIQTTAENLTRAVRSVGGGRSFQGKAVAEIWEQASRPINWLVQDILSADQPTIFGAKQKSLKTTLLADLAVSLASGYQWLGRYAIPECRRVLLITGESCETAAIRKVRRAAECRNLRSDDLGESLRIEAKDFPSLPSSSDCAAIRRTIERHGTGVVILDPLYMGLQGVNTSNLTEVGPAMRQFMDACRPAAVVIAHHVRKTASFDDAPNLEDLSQAGIAEFAGNYWLMGRTAEYLGDGRHELAVRYGGRDEQFGLLRLDFDERNWTADVSSLLDVREDKKQRRENERVAYTLATVKGYIERQGGQVSVASAADAAGTKPQREAFQRLLDDLVSSGQYERCTVKSSNHKDCDGIRVKGQMSTDSVR